MNDRPFDAPVVPQERVRLSLAPGSPSPERISVLSGDRACITCSFNLTGQHVVREPHYGMLVVVCPECGTPAALQEYPLLGKWAARWGAVLATLWLVVMLALAAGSGGAVFGFGYAAAEAAGTKFATYIAERHREWATAKMEEIKTQLAAGPLNSQQLQQQQRLTWMVTQQARAYATIDPGWWEEQDAHAMFAQAGGWWRLLDRNLVYVWAWEVIPLTAIGCLWSVALAHVRRARLWRVLPLIYAIAAVFAVITWYAIDNTMQWQGQYRSASGHAERFFLVPVQVATAAFSAIPLVIGLTFGRPLARALICVFLPPRLRVPFSFLWLCDGKAAPRTRG